MKSKILAIGAFSVVASSFATIKDARACAIACQIGDSPSIASESSVIVWDESRRIEHFIRKVDFKAHGSALGFLVPTPERPEIAEADEAVFGRLESLVPRMAMKKAGSASFAAISDAIVPVVTVLEQKRVAGMDVAVLEANNAAALNDWLKKNGFPSRPALQEWLDPYVRAGFKIAAFKYAKPDAGGAEIATKAVRISFTALKPFYPYRMPADTAVDSHQFLRVYVFASKKTRGYLTEGSDKRGWGQIIHIRGVSDLPNLLEGALPADKLPAGPVWLTIFNDDNVKRTGAAEMYFEKAE
ncbi:MAG: DUF2330 domain-containing protein [Deltaproteobacteria bacterium]|nr:DUF2330 domain-containing protein [Deltaproteobacteria bacterium]